MVRFFGFTLCHIIVTFHKDMVPHFISKIFELLLVLNIKNNFRIDTDLDIYLYFVESMCSRGKSIYVKLHGVTRVVHQMRSKYV